jgi:hypothetical protein
VAARRAEGAGKLAGQRRGRAGRLATVKQVVRGIQRAGRRPVFLAGAPSRLTPYGGQIRHIMRLRSTLDENALTAPPLHTNPFDVDVFMSEPTV